MAFYCNYFSRSISAGAYSPPYPDTVWQGPSFLLNPVISAFKQLADRLFRQKSIDSKAEIGHVQVAIRTEKLQQLLALKQICAADLQCLDGSSKCVLRELCLNTCLKTVKSETVDYTHRGTVCR